MFRTAARLGLAVVALLTFSGCAFGTRTTRLSWPPAGEHLAVEPPGPALAVSVAPVVDKRPEPRELVGAVRNLFGMHTADVVTPDDVSGWASAVIADELRRAGVRVVARGAGVPEVGADLRLVHGEAYFVYSAEVELRAWLRLGETVPLNRDVRVEVKGGTNWVGASEGYGLAIDQALREAARQVAQGVVAALGPPAATQAKAPAAPGS